MILPRCPTFRYVTPVTSAPDPDPLRARGQVAERRVALEEVVPGAADLRDLPEVVHHVDRVEAGRLRRGRDLRAAGPGVAAVPPVKPYAPRCRPNRSPVGCCPACRRAAGAAFTNASGTTRDRLRRQHRVVPLGRAAGHGSPPRSAAGRRARRPGCAWPGAGCAPGTRAAGVSKATATHGRSCCRASASQASRRSASSPSVSITVVSRRAEPPPHDLVQQRERVRARGDVVLAGADEILLADAALPPWTAPAERSVARKGQHQLVGTASSCSVLRHVARQKTWHHIQRPNTSWAIPHCERARCLRDRLTSHAFAR